MKNKILQYLQENGSITTFEAFTELGCTRLSEYIRQLRLEYTIQCEWLTALNRHGEKRRYKRFWLVQ